MAAIQSPEGDKLLADMDAEARLASFHLALPDGRVHSAGAAFGPLAQAMGRYRRLGRLADRFPGASAALYRFIATRRSIWGRFVSDRAKAAADRDIAARGLG